MDSRSRLVDTPSHAARIFSLVFLLQSISHYGQFAQPYQSYHVLLEIHLQLFPFSDGTHQIFLLRAKMFREARFYGSWVGCKTYVYLYFEFWLSGEYFKFQYFANLFFIIEFHIFLV